MRGRPSLLPAVLALLLVTPLASARDVPELPELLAVPQPDGWQLAAEGTVAFEEHALFTHAVVRASPAGQSDAAPRLVRRFLRLKPDLVVIDDVLQRPDPAGPLRYTIPADYRPEVVDGQVQLQLGGHALVCTTLLPGKATYTPVATGGPPVAPGGSPVATGGPPVAQSIAIVPQADSAPTRVIHLLQRRTDEAAASDPRPELRCEDGEVHLTLGSGGRHYRLILPPATEAAGHVAVSEGDGRELLPGRPLASGVLPFTPEGQKLLERWDSAYRDGRRPGWDVGRPASELKAAIAGGSLEPGRAVVLGCGTGTNAIHLAGQGFDVTGIDIAPTALARAEQKAGEAGVTVRWLVADVLAPPELAPFDVIFDRGCYHGVRRHDAAGYVAALRALSRPGTRVLILAGNANEPRHYGPPRVKEEELRADFTPDFKFLHLRQTHFDTRTEDAKGPWAWSILLERK